MRIHFIGLLLFLIALSGCSDKEINTVVPRCISDLVINFENTALCDDYKVDQYLFQNQVVYVFDNGSCGADMQAAVVDNNCNTIGALGGIAGNLEINNESFTNAVFIKTVYSNQ